MKVLLFLYTTCILFIPMQQASAQTPDAKSYHALMTSLRTGETEIFITDLLTGDAKNLSRSPRSEDRYASFAGDGETILFTSNRWDNDTAFNVFQMNLGGSNIKQLTFDKTEVAYYPGTSADGKKILYNLGHASSAVVMNSNGSAKKVFQDVRDAFLSPDGNNVAFTRRCGGGFCLFVMRSDGTGVQQLTTTPNVLGAVGPVISKDNRIAYVNQVDSTKEVLEIFSCNLDGSDKKQLTHLGKISTSPCWSPDGEWISFRVTGDAFWRNDSTRAAAYAQKEGDKRPVWMMRKDGSEPAVVQPLRFQCGIDGSRAELKKQ